MFLRFHFTLLGRTFHRAAKSSLPLSLRAGFLTWKCYSVVAAFHVYGSPPLPCDYGTSDWKQPDKPLLTSHSFGGLNPWLGTIIG
ncbi:hypothetical protein PAXRUDRAFT_379569 [Paxillus rubicundulus Ve08.2h10]|uniref:Uncharacterized protein n=1 Tax=Paxillus rubicundulus Ve08.2h10 TaxID=930991 RepID=A0A0D0D1H7_9AGAM|nr:hypothetical protein PAXRUDRAFT_379569 [Paxillus rubicundulus Ve08.2h10]